MTAAERTATGRRHPDRRCSLLLSLLDRLLERGVVPSGLSLDGLELSVSHLRSDEPAHPTPTDVTRPDVRPSAVVGGPRTPTLLETLDGGDVVARHTVVTPTDGPRGYRRRAHEDLRRLLRSDDEDTLTEG